MLDREKGIVYFAKRKIQLLDLFRVWRLSKRDDGLWRPYGRSLIVYVGSVLPQWRVVTGCETVVGLGVPVG